MIPLFLLINGCLGITGSVALFCLVIGSDISLYSALKINVFCFPSGGSSKPCIVLNFKFSEFVFVTAQYKNKKNITNLQIIVDSLPSRHQITITTISQNTVFITAPPLPLQLISKLPLQCQQKRIIDLRTHNKTF